MSILPATPEGVARAVAQLRSGGLLGLPTETVYGLAADARRPAAIAAVFAAKGRPVDHPLIVHLATAAEAAEWAGEWPEAAVRLAAAFWPGPLTLVVRRASHVLPSVTGGQDTVALRVPGHVLARQVLASFGGALVAPSANRYGQLSPTRASDVEAEFAGTVPVLDGGACEVGIESTIVACLDGRVRVLRPGLLTPGELSRATRTEVLVGHGAADPRVPGAVKAHYAPRTPLEVVPREALGDCLRRFADAAVVTPEGSASGAGPEARPIPAWPDRHRRLPADAVGYGRSLYATLRDLDALSAPRIFVEAPPAEESWAAVRDRLSRAAAAAELWDESVEGSVDGSVGASADESMSPSPEGA